jgi:telomere length regulation protein
MHRLKTFEQRKYLEAVIALAIKKYLPTGAIQRDDTPIPISKTVSAVASLLETLTHDNEGLKDHVVSILTRSTIPGLDESLAARRSIIAALAQDEGQTSRFL